MMANTLLLSIILPILLAALFWYAVVPPWWCRGLLCCCTTTHCKEAPIDSANSIPKRFQPLVDTLQKSLTQGWDLGASMYLVVDNGQEEAVVDVAGGYRDAQHAKVFTRDTLSPIFSSGKVLETIGMALLVDQGLVKLDAPLALYWPEFAQEDKANITIQDMLSHHSGSMTCFPSSPSVETLVHPRKRDDFLAAQPFLYPRGTVGYRGWGSALYTDAICRRVHPKKLSLAQFVQEEVLDPLGETLVCPPLSDDQQDLSEVYDVPTSTVLLGMFPQLLLPRSVLDYTLNPKHPLVLTDNERDLFRTAIFKQDANSPMTKATIPGVDAGAASFNDRSSFLAYEMLSSNCLSNARALGKAIHVFMQGKLVKPKTLEAFLKPFPSQYDTLFRANVSYTAGGFGVVDGGSKAPMFGAPASVEKCIGWGGMGGSMVVHCTTTNAESFSFSYVPNGMAPSLYLQRAVNLLQVAADVVVNG